MKTILNFIFSAFFAVISCHPAPQATIEEFTLLRIGFYPTNHSPSETLLNLSEKYILFFSPTNEAPPPPITTNETQKSHQEHKLKPFKANLDDHQIHKVKSLLARFNQDDFKALPSPPNDSLWTNFLIIDSQNKIIEINPRHSANEKQKELYTLILELLVEVNPNKENKAYFDTLKAYK
ncbi:hypothetical protein [Bergeyella sp. RCAD1439]|uniref:hypothetical protein n=1 Tax=Bergeyella anatis TaxID=3113737 RepID=UPI002E18702B|nr:hypothetical protein [Bergeyella sp. RCAD1439]